MKPFSPLCNPQQFTAPLPRHRTLRGRGRGRGRRAVSPYRTGHWRRRLDTRPHLFYTGSDSLGVFDHPRLRFPSLPAPVAAPLGGGVGAGRRTDRAPAPADRVGQRRLAGDRRRTDRPRLHIGLTAQLAGGYTHPPRRGGVVRQQLHPCPAQPRPAGAIAPARPRRAGSGVSGRHRPGCGVGQRLDAHDAPAGRRRRPAPCAPAPHPHHRRPPRVG